MLDYAYVRIEQCLKDTIKYINLKTSHDTFLVTRNFATFPYTGCAHIPRFRRVRKVTFRHGKLCCDCHSSSVWGMLCVHSLNVARTCDASYVPSKCDISCIWWKTYQDVATNLVTDESSVDCLLKLFALLKKKEVIGATVDPNLISIIPIPEGNLPDEFIYDKSFPTCTNYPLSLCSQLWGRDVPGNMSQMTNVGDTQNDSSDDYQLSDNESGSSNVSDDFEIFDKDIDNLFNDMLTKVEVTSTLDPVKGPYAFLKASFTEMAEIMKSNATEEAVKEVKLYLDQVTNNIIKRIGSKTKRKKNTSKYVSSNVRFKKTRKTHGTKKM